MSDNLTRLSATDLIEVYRSRKVSPVDVCEAVLGRIAETQDSLNAFVTVDGEGALAAARNSEARWRAGEPRGLIDGVPTSIKDLLLAKGMPTLRGSLSVDREQSWNEDSPAAARLREHGAVILGKTTTPEFGHKAVTDSPLSGITRNPWDPDKTPGGSSGGAAAAVAAGMGPLAVGTDGGGSIRIPSSFSGIFGIKATFGRVPSYPGTPNSSVSHVGPMTRTVADAALMLTVLSEPDWRDWYALPHDGTDYRANLEEPLSGVRVAYSPTLGMGDVAIDAEVRASTYEAAKTFEDLGATVEEANPFWPHEPGEVFGVHWAMGAAALVASMPAEKQVLLEESLLRSAEAGRGLDGLTVKRAEMARVADGLALAEFFEHHDLILSPTLPVPAFKAGQQIPSEAYAENPLSWIPYTFPINLTRNPAASVPCGFTAAGLPVGLQVIGPLFGETMVLRACRTYEEANPCHQSWPKL
ncbi:MAG: amidase [Alphaproteobacteria bacterium]|nr:amidase [Alphaproteobacteria bacterium]